MKVIDKKDERTEFENIKEGEVFLYCCFVYIKIEEFKDSRNRICNSVRLTDGCVFCFSPDEEVLACKDACILLNSSKQ